MSLLTLVACVPRPPVYVLTKSSFDSLVPLKSARLEAQPVAKVDLHDFKRAFVKKYESEAAFIQGFNKDLAQALAEGASGESPVFRVELPLLDVDSHTISWTTMAGAGPAMHMQTHSVEYCDIRLSYAVKDDRGRVVLEGVVKESTSKGEFLHPNQSKLANAVNGVRQHLVDYLRGRMPAEHVASPEPAANPSGK